MQKIKQSSRWRFFLWFVCFLTVLLWWFFCTLAVVFLQTCRAFAYISEKHWSTWCWGGWVCGRVILGQGNNRSTWQANNGGILSAATKGACLVSLLACRPHPAAPLPLCCEQPLSLWPAPLSPLLYSEMKSNLLLVFSFSPNLADGGSWQVSIHFLLLQA